MCIYIYMYMYIHTYIYIYMYIYEERSTFNSLPSLVPVWLTSGPTAFTDSWGNHLSNLPIIHSITIVSIIGGMINSMIISGNHLLPPGYGRMEKRRQYTIAKLLGRFFPIGYAMIVSQASVHVASVLCHISKVSQKVHA